jgi:hypothetical protein
MKKTIIAGTFVAVAALSACAGGDSARTATDTPTTPATTTTTTTNAPVPTTTAAPVIIPTTTEAPVTPDYTPAQQNAIRSAESYLAMTGFSRAGLIEQLSSEYGEKFAMADSVFAVDNIVADWNAEAVESATSYMEISGFSRAGLIEQLSSEYGAGFTLEQATYAADQLGL